jgi:mono/diheme cytochrome c family protein
VIFELWLKNTLNIKTCTDLPLCYHFRTTEEVLVRIFKMVCLIIAVAVMAFVAIGMYRFYRPLDVPFPKLSIPPTPDLIARGEYLVHGPAHCSNCHGDPAKRSELLRGEKVPLIGGERIELPIALLFPPNLTPDPATGIGRLSDEQLLRVMRHSVSSKGHPMMPFMPFEEVADSDLAAILAYLRSTEPVNNPVPEHEFNFLGKLIRGFLITPHGAKEPIPASLQPNESPEYGKYLAYKVANCHGCHTNRSLFTGEFTGEPFAGGLELPAIGDPNRKVISPDITPNGLIGRWSATEFVARFRDLSHNVPGTHMPWGSFSRMTDSDLTAVYNFLKTLPAR